MLERLINIEKSEKKSYFQRRLVSEMKFAMLLAEKSEHQYDALIREAEDYVAAACEKDGIITREIMENAEKILMPLSPKAKEYEAMCAAHAHIDMNWQWGWDETVKVVLDTTKSILQIMEEYPDFKFSQSQASVYKILEDYAPELLEKVKAKVKEGRWEVSASTWVEADKNMPSGESAARQLLYAKKYLSGLLDISLDDMVLDFEPDTFGHHVNIPEILRNANVKYYYHCRGMNDCDYQLYVWRAPSGAEVLVNRERNFYNMDTKRDVAFHVFKTAELTGVKKTLQVYGVGDHGGGPTRRDVSRLIDMNKWPIYPTFSFTTYREFFEAVEPYKANLPVYEGEMNCIFDGCFTSQSRNKNGNRRSEELMYKTEVFSAFAALEGKTYPRQMMEETWRKTLLNQFHDIVTGSGVRATREYALGVYQEVKAASDSMRNHAYEYLADRINTELIVKEEEIGRNEPDFARAYGAGVGSGQVERGSGNTRIFHVFNPTAKERTQNVELLLWEWYGDVDRIQITDARGRKVPCQLLDRGFNDYWFHNYMRLLVQVSVPGFGYTTLKLTEGELKNLPVVFHWERRHQEKEQFVLENEFLRVAFDRVDASIVSVLDKETGEELIDGSRKTGIFQYVIEANHKAVSEWRSEMSSWLVGRFKTVESIHQDLEITMQYGELRNSLCFEGKFHHSGIQVEVSLDAGCRYLNYKVTCDWHEIGSEETGVPRLQFSMPLPYRNQPYVQDIPFGLMEREEMGTDMPALSFTAAFDEQGKRGIAISSKNTYGYRCEEDTIALALLRSPYDPDPYPENGICPGEFCVSFLDGRESKASLQQRFREYNCTMDVVSGGRHPGQLKPEASCLEVEGEGVLVSSLKVAESTEELIVRLYEAEGKAEKAALIFAKPVEAAAKTDLLERELEPVQTAEDRIEVSLQPYEIVTLKVKI